jgi:hypothetical protein
MILSDQGKIPLRGWSFRYSACTWNFVPQSCAVTSCRWADSLNPVACGMHQSIADMRFSVSDRFYVSWDSSQGTAASWHKIPSHSSVPDFRPDFDEDQRDGSLHRRLGYRNDTKDRDVEYHQWHPRRQLILPGSDFI